MSQAEDKQLGAEFERELIDCFTDIQKKFPMTWHRFVDSKAARNLVAAQPADFLVCSEAGAYLLEAKASVAKESLAEAKGYVKPAQIGSILKWHRAGHPSCVIFYCQTTANIELWDGMVVANGNFKLGPICTFEYFDLKECLKEWLGLL